MAGLLIQHRDVFAYQWTTRRWELTLRRRQKQVIRRALRQTSEIDWHRLRRRLGPDERVTVAFGRLGGNAMGLYEPVTKTLKIDNGYLEWSVEKTIPTVIHELWHAYDLLVFDTEDRDAVFAVFHDGQRPDGHYDPTRWNWPECGLFPQHGTSTREPGDHAWFESAQYREGIGEAFAEACLAAFTDYGTLPYEHGWDEAKMQQLRQIVLAAQ